MKRITIPGALALAAAAVLGTGCNLQWSPYAAKVGTTVITPAQLNGDLHQASSNPDFRCLLQRSQVAGSRLTGAGSSTYDSTFVAYMLTNLVDSDVAHTIVTKEGLTEPPAARSLARDQVESSFQSGLQSTQCGLASTKLLSQLGPSLANSFVQLQLDEDALAAHDLHVTLTSSGILAYERAHPAATQESCISGLFISSKTTAARVERKWRHGEPLESLITTYAPTQASSHGSLGCYTTSQLSSIDPVIKRRVTTASIGTILAPIHYQNSYVVLQLSSRRFEPVVNALDAIFASATSKFSAQIRQAVRSADVQVNPEYGRWEIDATSTAANASGFGGRVLPNSGPASGDLLKQSAVQGPSLQAPTGTSGSSGSSGSGASGSSGSSGTSGSSGSGSGG